MTAIRLHRPGAADALLLEQIDRPTAGPGQVLVEVAAVGVNYADVMTARGVYPVWGELPAVLGFEAVGTVREAGPGVDRDLIGRRVAVMGPGAYAQYVTADAAVLLPTLDGLTWAQAAALPAAGLTAYGMLTAARLGEGETVLVHAAAGGVGTVALQAARALGARRVLATAGTADKRALATRLGADQTIDYTRSDWASSVDAGSVDVILDLVGGDVTGQSLPLLTPATGRMVLGGMAAGTPRVDPVDLVSSAVSLIGYSNPPWLARPDFGSSAMRRLLEWLGDGRLELVVGRTWPLAEAVAALTALERRETTGKTVLLTGAGS